jgi:hypothetical protein
VGSVLAIYVTTARFGIALAVWVKTDPLPLWIDSVVRTLIETFLSTGMLLAGLLILTNAEWWYPPVDKSETSTPSGSDHVYHAV